MKIIFFGLGSIGLRHAKILVESGGYTLVAYRSGAKPGVNNLGIREVSSWEGVVSYSPDIAFITNPTFMHIETALKCSDIGIRRLFIEKPIGCSEQGLDELLTLVNKKKMITYVAYNLRFHPVISYLKERLKGLPVYHVCVRNTSYFPEWRPWQDHLGSYTSFDSKSGGISLELSHEFDYIRYLFGDIINMDGKLLKKAKVTVDSHDLVDVFMETEITSVDLHMNIFSRMKERSIKIESEKGSFYCDLNESFIEERNQNGRKIHNFDTGISETYRSQISYFMKNINNPRMMNNLWESTVLFKKILGFKKRS
jgi:predicted dehydrogenase